MSTKVKTFLTAGLLLFISCGTLSAADNGISATALVDRASALIGDRVKLTIDIDYNAGTDINLPEFKENKIDDFEIKDSGRELKKSFFGGDIITYWYFIAAYSTGKHQIPQIDIKYKKKGANGWKTVQTRALNVTIESVLPKDKMPADIKDVTRPLQYFEINWFLVSGVIIFFSIILSAILYKFRKRAMPVKRPHETALEELEAARGNFLKNSDVKEYYTGISDCIRRYIERSFKMKAPEMTTEEFLCSLKESTRLSLDQKDLLKDFLNVCDLVKFAKYTPAKGEMEKVFIAAKKFIEETKEISYVRL